MTRRAACDTSGPMPSPGMSVTRCAIETVYSKGNASVCRKRLSCEFAALEPCIPLPPAFPLCNHPSASASKEVRDLYISGSLGCFHHAPHKVEAMTRNRYFWSIGFLAYLLWATAHGGNDATKSGERTECAA